MVSWALTLPLKSSVQNSSLRMPFCSAGSVERPDGLRRKVGEVGTLQRAAGRCPRAWAVQRLPEWRSQPLPVDPPDAGRRRSAGGRGVVAGQPDDGRLEVAQGVRRNPGVEPRLVVRSIALRAHRATDRGSVVFACGASAVGHVTDRHLPGRRDHAGRGEQVDAEVARSARVHLEVAAIAVDTSATGADRRDRVRPALLWRQRLCSATAIGSLSFVIGPADTSHRGVTSPRPLFG